MDEERRRRLEQRRQELHEELELRERRESVREQTDLLDAHGISYELLVDYRPQVDWARGRFPFTGGLFSPRIDWARVPLREPGPGPDAAVAAVSAWLSRVSEEHSLGNPEVVLLNGNGVKPAIRLAFAHLRAHPEVASLESESWVVCESGGWALEFQPFRDGWWWGRTAPED